MSDPGATPTDDWPTEAEMADRCWCGHTLGQHEYGAEPSPCDLLDCDCTGWDIPESRLGATPQPERSRFRTGDVERLHRLTSEGAAVVLANDCEWYVDSWQPAVAPDSEETP